METESLRLLRQRRAEIVSRFEEARARLKLYESELHQIDAGIKAMEADNVIAPTGNDASLRAVAHHARKGNPEVQSMTMKQLVVKALSEHLENGATANQLLDFFAREWGRNDITRTSLSPQLSRLKVAGKIALVGKVWMMRDKYVERFGDALKSASANLFENENGEAEASPDAGGAPTPLDHEPSSAEHPTRGGSAPGEEETT